MKLRRHVRLPPTRNHRQLAAYINTHRLYNQFGQEVCAHVEARRVSTDRHFRGSRLRSPGKGRFGLLLRIMLNGASLFDPSTRLYEHSSAETYRRHSDAREWVEQNLYERPRRKR